MDGEIPKDKQYLVPIMNEIQVNSNIYLPVCILHFYSSTIKMLFFPGNISKFCALQLLGRKLFTSATGSISWSLE